jgi:4-alpha-glucanotransferase
MANVPEVHGGDALRELADRCGISREGRGRNGEPRAVTAATLRALLAGLGMAAQSDDEVARSIARLDEEPWQSVLPPVQVVRENEPCEVEIRLPEADAHLRWRLVLESGAERSGEAALSDLPFAGRRTVAARELQCRRLRLDSLPMGYHRLEVAPAGTMSLIAAPARCWLPSGERCSGVSAQVYLLRSRHNWGIGDFGDLRELVNIVGACGGDVVGVNPLHALFVDNPAHASPYGPSSRLLLNVLNICVERVPEYSSSPRTRALVESAGFRSSLEALRGAELVAFEAVARAKLEALGLLFDEACEAGGARLSAFEQFRSAAGSAFELHCVYLALRRHLAARGHGVPHWRDWPGSLGDSRSPQVASFASEHARDVTREAWLQFVADEQLAAADGRAAGMRVGLYRDLAVGADSSGAETWSEPDLVAPGVHVGAPPDALSETGQNWGLPPWNPRRLRESGYRSFVDLLRANMRHAGALRIDHAMALERLFWIPEGRDARDGAYVRYPREDLFALVALESHRAQCMVVGEDLGTLPEGFRERMAAANMLSYRVLRFENDNGRPVPPARYPYLALAVAGNHDLPTLKAWWEGADLALQSQHGALSASELVDAQRERVREQGALLEALEREGLLESGDCSFEEFRSAVHRYLGRTNALLALAQLEDIAGQEEPVNVPNLPNYPSWQRRVGPTLEELDASDAFASVIAALAHERSAARDGARPC